MNWAKAEIILLIVLGLTTAAPGANGIIAGSVTTANLLLGVGGGKLVGTSR